MTDNMNNDDDYCDSLDIAARNARNARNDRDTDMDTSLFRYTFAVHGDLALGDPDQCSRHGWIQESERGGCGLCSDELSQDQEQEELEAEYGARFGDPRRCARHNVVTSSPDGLHDGLCAACEGEMDDDEQADRAAQSQRVAILVDDVVIGDGANEDEARADVDESCIPEGYEDHEYVARTYDARTHEVGMGQDGYVILREIHYPSAITPTAITHDDCIPF